jgi:hypothetical protein
MRIQNKGNEQNEIVPVKEIQPLENVRANRCKGIKWIRRHSAVSNAIEHLAQKEHEGRATLVRTVAAAAAEAREAIVVVAFREVVVAASEAAVADVSFNVSIPVITCGTAGQSPRRTHQTAKPS